MAQRYSLLQYDIRTGSDIPNPSGRFRRFMVRTSFSVWVTPDERVPYGLLEQWSNSGQVRWHLVPFAAEGTEAIIKMCTEALTNEIEAMRNSVNKSLAEAAEKANKTIAGGNRYAAEKDYEQSARRITARAERILGDLEAAAKVFGIANLGFGSTVQAVQTMGLTARTRLDIYKSLVEQMKGTPLEAAATAGDMPVGVLADFVEETTDRDMAPVRAVLDGVVAPDDRKATGCTWVPTGTTPPPAPPTVAEVAALIAEPTVPVSELEKPVITRTVAYGNGQSPKADRCPRCGAGLTQPKANRYGKRFRGCTRFPACRGAVDVN